MGGGRAALWLAVALAVLGVAERGGRALVSRHALPTRGARWIWTQPPLEPSTGQAFYAVRDFELDAPPDRARVHVLADEAYLLHVNGRRVGSGVYYARAPLDTYTLDAALRPGWNRLAVELRSRRAAGGLLLALYAEGERDPLVVSDGEWRTFTDVAGVLDGTRPFADGEPARVWQSPPHGGWGVPRLGPERPTFDHAVAAHPGRLDAAVLEPRPEEPPNAEGGAQGDGDFGAPVAGFLLLRGLDAAPRRMRIDIGIHGPNEEVVDVLLASGQTTWSTAEARTLRYAVTVGLPESASMGLLPVDPSVAAEDARRAGLRASGVFGVEPPRKTR